MEIESFEKRKEEHLHWALDPRVQAHELRDLDQIQLVPEALPSVDLEEIRLETQIFGTPVKAPVFISSMTAGHKKGRDINRALAKAAQSQGWMMGVGSQRRELVDEKAREEWKQIRQEAPRALLFGNLGISQLIHTPVVTVQRLVEDLEAKGIFIHLNALQECIQTEGTPQFKGALQALENCAKSLSVPVVVKEVGCGFSGATLRRLRGTGVSAVDVSGAGGTHWGRLEGLRASPGSSTEQLAKVFENWGLTTVQSLVQAASVEKDYEIWGSGGVRSGLDVAKLMVLGAKMVGVAQPFIKEVLRGDDVIAMQANTEKKMQQFERELRVALFCMGAESVNDIVGRSSLIVNSPLKETR